MPSPPAPRRFSSQRADAELHTQLEIASSCGAQLGEGPLWDSWAQTLWWVDVDRHQLWRQVRGGPPFALDVGQEVAAVMSRSDGGLALIARRSIILTDDELTITAAIPVPLPSSETMRLNDAGCDPAGRLWFGSMSTAGDLNRGSLYTLQVDHSVSRAISAVSISNGLAWSPDGRRMYYVDTPTRRVDAFPFDPQTGALGARRTLATISASDGRPDGLTVDAEGGVWVALWGGAAVRRFTASGQPAGRISLPTQNVTSCCFGGPRFDELYITTARRGLSARELDAEPTAGSVFVCRPGPSGLPSDRYGG